ncbi:MAG: PDZ domain-containing protein [Singulisphaera sp.]
MPTCRPWPIGGPGRRASRARQPGRKAGEVSDILAVGDVPVSDFDSLVARIQANGGKPVPLQVLRAGKPMTTEVTPALKGKAAAREVALDEGLVCPALNAQAGWSKGLPVAYDPLWRHPPHETWVWDTWSKSSTPSNQPLPGSTADSDRVEKRLDALGRELKQLQESIESLRKTLKPDDKLEGRRK